MGSSNLLSRLTHCATDLSIKLLIPQLNCYEFPVSSVDTKIASMVMTTIPILLTSFGRHIISSMKQWNDLSNANVSHGYQGASNQVFCVIATGKRW